MKQKLSKNGCYRLIQIMLGEIPVIKKFGIISSGNTIKQTMNSPESNRAAEEIIKYLKDGNYPFIQTKGSNAEMTDPFLILNISDDQLRNLCILSLQKNFISARVKDEERIELKLLNNKFEALNEAEIHFVPDDPEESYICSQSNDLVIPFFDARWNESLIATNLVTPGRISYQSEELNDINFLSERIQTIMQINQKYEANGKDAFEYGGFANWGRRGMMLTTFNSIQIRLIELNYNKTEK